MILKCSRNYAFLKELSKVLMIWFDMVISVLLIEMFEIYLTYPAIQPKNANW